MHRLAVELNFTCATLLDTGHIANKRRLARSVVAHHCNVLPLLQEEICIVKCLDSSIVFGQAPGLQYVIHRINPFLLCLEP